MADSPHRHNMSLVPYVPAQSQEIVFRHGSAVVVYDERSKQLSLRDVSHSNAVEITKCPTCHRPLRQSAEDSDSDSHEPLQDPEAGFVNPDYFRMLQHSTPGSRDSSRPPSPLRRTIPPRLPNTEDDSLHTPDGVEFVGSAPSPQATAHGISSSAFSQNYFKSFFVEERELGRGGKGVVLLVKHILDGVSLGNFACKRVPVGDDHEWLKKVLVEVQLLQNLSHQNLVSYRHVWLENYQITPFGPSVPCAFILQQYCNSGDLHQYILGSAKTSMTKQQLKEQMRRKSRGQLDSPTDMHSPRKLQFEEILSFFRDITSGLNHLHANGYIHRDLKPSNCLLNNDGHKLRVLVSDFGEVQMVNATRKSTGATGTISYCAPEVLKRQAPGGLFGNFSTKSDIFSLGMIVYFMCFGRLPYRNADGIDEDNEDLDQLRDEIAKWAGFDDRNRVRSDLPEKLYRSLKRLLATNPAERPGTEEILYGIRAGSMVDELGGFAAPSFLDEMGPRISRADTPSPVSSKQSGGRRQAPHTNYVRPGPSKLRSNPLDNPRTPSPPLTSKPSSTDGSPLPDPSSSVILRPRKSTAGLEPNDTDTALPSAHEHPPPRLMLPPPPAFPTRFHHLLHHTSPFVLALVKISLFCAKVLSLSRPCAPFAANPWVAYPLLCLGALDFASPTSIRQQPYFDRARKGGGGEYESWIASAVLLGLHVVVVLVAARWDGLCLRSGLEWHEI